MEVDRDLFNECLQIVECETLRAHEKHGPESMISPDVDPGMRLAILVEEVGEVARALTYDEADLANLREELVQVAAMATSWLYALRIEKVEGLADA